MRSCAVWLCGIGLWLAGGPPLAAAPSPWHLGRPEAVVASAGVFEPIVERGGSYEIGAEFQFAPRRFRFLPQFLPELIPAAGVMAGAQGSLYVYGGFRMELPLGQRWTVNPGWATGLYYRSPEFDLGGPLEFRTSVELAYRLRDGSRLGVCLYHLSNAGLFEVNPGSESLVVTYSTGLRRRR
jgi:lipid A 3-O-deacylase